MFEVANSLLILRRRRRIEAQEYEQARIDLTDLRPAIDEEGPVLAFGRIIELADQYSLSVYDAAYLELALRKTIGLASRDSALNKAAKRAGVKTLL
jgi:predicted nucleic acid-binding protein